MATSTLGLLAYPIGDNDFSANPKTPFVPSYSETVSQLSLMGYAKAFVNNFAANPKTPSVGGAAESVYHYTQRKKR